MKTIKIKAENFRELYRSIFQNSQEDFIEIDKAVNKIINDVRKLGDKALYDYTHKFDGCELRSLKVSDEEIEEALRIVDNNFIEILKAAKENIFDFHLRQKENSWFFNKEGVTLGQLVNPLSRVGIYVPGGKAAYPSTVLMNSIPAIIAGVESIAMVTPPDKDGRVNPYVLVAAGICGVKEIYKLGGAQAIAALAYGTESVMTVDKIVGPGNIYVARGKRAVFGTVDIDMIAGPSEVCVVADEGANPKYIAADLLSQAEHDEMAKCILITTSEKIAYEVNEEIVKQTAKLGRKTTIEKSLADNGFIFIVDDLYEGLEIANEIAPEHLELMVESPFELLSYVRNAGAVFLGAYCPEPLGDYYAGPNHTLPTSGTARFSSPLGVYDFIKKSSLIYYNRQSLEGVKDKVIDFALAEGLSAHANSIKVRFSQ